MSLIGLCQRLGLALAASFCLTAAAAAQTGAPGVDGTARGEYLTRAADCVVCHTAPGGKSFAGGLAFDLGFGTLYSANITPDRDSGIGGFTDDDFVNALQKGVSKDGVHLYPAMPYASYTGMPREDILAIKAYLFSLPPEKSAAPANQIDFPFNQRWGVALWNLFFNPDRRFQADSAKTAAQNRGAYLVEVLGHCQECHTPRNVALAVDRGQKFAGALTQGWAAYNLTSDRQSGVGAWSDEQLAAYLSTGHAEGRSSAAGPMAEVVEHSLRHLTKDDIAAIVAYLRTLPAIAGGAAPADNPPAKSGKIAGADDSLGVRTFASECANCHRFDGGGAQTAHASLIGNRTVNDPRGVNLVRVILSGVKLNGLISMPGFDGSSHSDDEIAAVANFVNGTFGNGQLKLVAADIERIRHPKMETISRPQLYLAGAAAIVGGIVVLGLLIALLRRLFGRGRRRSRYA